VRHVRERRAKWKLENAEAIAQYNDFIAVRGIFSEGQRSF
jgi:post-segregation antitoxin (ccd killing protein)